MRKIKGFRLGNRLVKVFKCFNRRRINSRTIYQHLSPRTFTARAMSKLCNWGRSLTRGATGLCFSKPNSGYIRVGQEHVDAQPIGLPKGHLAVYVGEKEDDTCRVLVPVIYFNHPLFGHLLKEAEKAHGFDHPGGIQIPCRISEFENVQMQIAAAGGDGNSPRRLSLRRRY